MREFDLLVIGSGPGGYVAAIRAAQLGLKTAITEKAALGGTCVNWGCIPTKAILSSAEGYATMKSAESLGLRCDGAVVDMPAVIKRSRDVAAKMGRGVAYLLKKNKVEFVAGRAVVASPRTVRVGDEEIFARAILVAVGTSVKGIPGFVPDGKSILTSDDALMLSECPKSVAVLGGGAVGVEFGYAWSTFGAQVTIVEMMDQLLPRVDTEVARALEKSLSKQGIRVMTGATAKAYDAGSGTLTVGIGDREEAVAAEKVLVAVGRKPMTEGIGLESVGVRLERGIVMVDAEYRTDCPSIFAIGDVIGGMMLAHEAMAEGIAAAEIIAGQKPGAPVDRDRIPSCVYCEPEVATVGLSEEEAKRRGIAVKTSKVAFLANGRATAAGHTEGFVKLVADERYGQLLGCHIIGHGASESIAEAALGISLETTVRELGRTVHAHPTLSEGLREAARILAGEAIDS
ncbi:MAG TPA: dihydrolipoyl dehydrogenase [Candidatus Deferrimicrobiaceae bacterium]|jgi:dihydrolipoamide dehydrogenase